MLTLAQMIIEYEQTDPGQPAQVLDVIIDDIAKKVVVDVIMYTKAKESGKEYPSEFVFTLSMVEDGSQIKEIRQNADTGMARTFLEDVQGIKEKIGGMEERINR